MSVLDNLKAANATGTARGTFPIIKNSANGKMKNLKLFGASTKAEGQIESKVVNQIYALSTQLLNLKANTSSSASGLSISIKDGYIITISGKSNETWANLSDYDTKKMPQGKYTFSIDKSPIELGLGKICIKFRKSMSDSAIVTHQITGTNKSITFDRSNDYELIQIYADEIDITKMYDFTIKVMLNAGETALPFESYKGNIANLPDAIEINGFGGVRDYVDVKRVVKVQKFAKITANKLSTFHSNYSVGAIALDNNIAILTDWTIPYQNMLCNIFSNVYSRTELLSNTSLLGIALATSENGSCTIFFRITDIEQTEEAYNAYLSKTPLEVVFERAEPIETPLSPAALLELNKLRTFDSITCVSNDAGAEMEIEYFKNNKIGQEMSDIHAGVPRFVLDGTTLHVIV